MYKGHYELVENWRALQRLFNQSDFTEGLRVWEFRTNREKNLLEHRQMTEKIQNVLNQQL